MWNRSPANTKFDSCDITRTNCSVACGVKPDFLEISASQQSQMDSLGGLNTLWMNMPLQQPAMRSRRGWNKALCNKDGGAQRTTVLTAEQYSKKIPEASVPCHCQNVYSLLILLFAKQKLQSLDAYVYTMSLSEPHTFSHMIFLLLSLYRENKSPEIYLISF